MKGRFSIVGRDRDRKMGHIKNVADLTASGVNEAHHAGNWGASVSPDCYGWQ